MAFAPCGSVRGQDDPGSGLAGVVVADTRLSSVDGAAGRLIIAGRRVEPLVESVGFEGAAGLLLGRPPLGAVLGRARRAAFERLGSLGSALDAQSAMGALRGAVAQMDAEPREDVAVELVGAVAVFAAAWARRRQGLEPVEPDPELSLAGDLLRMLSGAAPAPDRSRALDAYLTTVIDHGMNASTFAARVVASTGSDMVAAVTAALGALAGPLHGGAPGPVLDMLDAIEAEGDVDAWLRRELEAGRRIMGMGHRVYRVRDPRAAVLERWVGTVGSKDPARSRLARRVEERAEALLAERHPGRPLRANVEFFTAILLEALEIPRDLFSAVFASARVAGWCAHVLEQWESGRLIRPSSRYVGAVEPEAEGAAVSAHR